MSMFAYPYMCIFPHSPFVSTLPYTHIHLHSHLHTYRHAHKHTPTNTQAWEMSDYSSDFCKTIGVEMRGMRFARDVRRQIARIVQGGGARGGDREGGGGPPAAKKARHEQQTVSGMWRVYIQDVFWVKWGFCG